jgi:type II secretory pathway pseudopilin PulG
MMMKPKKLAKGFLTDRPQHADRPTGLTLVEILIALCLMGFVSLSISNFLIKGNVATNSLGDVRKGTAEIQLLMDSLRRDLSQGAYISDNSYDQRLEYTIPDASGNALKKIYRLYTTGGSTYLQLSLDNGSTWGSPYAVSPYTKYKIINQSGVGTAPRFVYAGIKDCVDFQDTNANFIFDPGTVNSDGSYTVGADTIASSSCSNFSGSAMKKPSEAKHIDLQYFNFSTQTGSPVASRPLPANNYFIAVAPGLVRSTSTPLPSPAVKDPPLLQSFVTNTANSLYTTGFAVRGVTLDPSHQRLVLVGNHSSGSSTMYAADRDGVLMGSPLTTSVTTLNFDSVAMEADGKTILALDGTNKIVYRYDISGTSPITPTTTLNMGSATNQINTPKSVMYDPSTSSYFYVVGADTSTGAWKIFEFSKTTSNAAATATWALPAAFDGTHPPSGLALEPNTGDFLIVRNYVNGSGATSAIDIYRLTRAGVSTSFSININDLGSTATGTTGNFGMAYEPKTNRIFLTDSATNKVYEVMPSLLISPRT